jgi:hypothetical protein
MIGLHRRRSFGAVTLDLGGELAIQFLCARSNGPFVVSSHRFAKPPARDSPVWPQPVPFAPRGANGTETAVLGHISDRKT